VTSQEDKQRILNTLVCVLVLDVVNAANAMADYTQHH